VGFEPTILASEQAKTVHALDRAATVTGIVLVILHVYIILSDKCRPRKYAIQWERI
jgi:hypothetical protein